MNFERRKDITEWAKKAEKTNIPIGASQKNILGQSLTKKERIEKSGLPSGISYGPSDSFEELEKLIPKEKTNSLYFIRCAPKNYQNNNNLEIRRPDKISSLEECKEFYKKLPGDPRNYSIQLFESWEPKYSGGIVVNNGRVMVDMQKGDFFYSNEDEIKEVKGATLDTTGDELDRIDINFEYLNNPSEEEKAIMMKALKYLNPNLKRDIFEKLKVYTEFFYNPEHGFKFIDYIEGKDVDKYASLKKNKEFDLITN